MRRAHRWLGIATIVTATVVYAGWSGHLAIPDRWNPWAPLAVEEAPNWLTRIKLARLASDAPQCLATLAQTGWRHTAVPDRKTESGCGLNNAVRLFGNDLAVSEAFVLSCRSAVALALWERHVLQPAAHTYFGTRVARLDHFGSYACRSVYGRTGAALSRHATADAVDIAGFVLANGARIRVIDGWGARDREGGFLRAVRDGACRVFDGVLSPEYNAAHRDLHFDRGGWRVCR